MGCKNEESTNTPLTIPIISSILPLVLIATPSQRQQAVWARRFVYGMSAQENTRRPLYAYKADDSRMFVSSLAFSPDGKTFVMGGSGRTLRLWDAKTGRLTQTLEEHTDTVDRVAFSPDGKTLLCYGGESLTLWDAKTATLKHVLEHPARIHSAEFSPDGKTIMTQAMRDASVRLWDVSTGEHIRTLTGHTDQFYSVIFSPDGKTFATRST